MDHSDKPLSRASLVEARHDWLLTTSFLGQLDETTLDEVLSRMRRRRFAAGEPLITLGRRAEGIDLIVRGEVRVDVEGDDGELRAIARLGPGHMVGERSISLETVSLARVSAISPVSTLHLTAADFRWMLERSDDLRDFVGDLIELRDNGERIVRLLQRNNFLRWLGRAGIEALLLSARVEVVDSGDAIVRAGERTTDAYVVYQGQVAVYAPARDGEQAELLTTEGPGWLFGHAAALLERPRTADVRAVGPTRVLRWSAPALMAAVNRNPALSRRMYQSLAATRLHLDQPTVEKAQLVSVYGVRPGLGTTTIAYGLAASLAEHGPVTLIDLGGEATAARLGLEVRASRRGAVRIKRMVVPGQWPMEVIWPTRPEDTLPLMERLEAASGGFVLVAARARDELNVEAMARAETVVFVRSASDGTHDEAAERGQRRIDAIRIFKNSSLPLETTSRGHVRIPADGLAGTRFWRTGDIGHLVDPGRPLGRSVARLGRALRNRTVGLALGGGGAFGFGHVGLLRALEESGIPVDYVAGASFGALVAGTYAANGLRAVDDVVRRRKDLRTAAWKSVISTDFFARFVDEIVSHRQMGETEIPFYPVAVDVLSGQQIIPAHGTVGFGVQSSSGLPPMFGAMRSGSRRLVDGGIDNNVPVSVVWDAGAHFIIGSNAIPRVAAGRAAYVRENFFDRTVPRVVDLIRSAYHLMAQNGRDRAQLADYVFDMRDHGHTLVDFMHGDIIAEAGYQQAMAEMDDIRFAYANM